MRPLDKLGEVNATYWSLTGFLAAAACALRMAGPQSDAAGKRFDPPPAGQGAIYIYREGKTYLDQTSRFRMFVQPVKGERRRLGVLDEITWLRVDLPPGNYDAGCEGGDKGHHSQEYVVLEAGEFAFVKIGVYPGRWVVNCQTFSVPAAVGREEVLRGKRVQELPPRTQ